MKTNYHTHTTWCDGKDTPEEVVLSAVGKGFSRIGFSSHAMLPGNLLGWTLDETRSLAYAAEIRSLAAKYAGTIEVLCGVEADYLAGSADPDRATYAFMKPDYIIGSVHFVLAPDGGVVCVDKSPEDLSCGIRDHFDGSAEAFIRAYFAQEREMVGKYDFDIVGHPDLVRKFNVKAPYFDETAPWYLDELAKTADAIAASGKTAEINTGAISRGWLDDVYPSEPFRTMLRERGVRLILGSDAHSADAIDCAFGRFADVGDYVRLP